MVVKYSKIFTVTNVSGEPVTVLIEVIGPDNKIAITTLEGGYSSADELEVAFYLGNSKSRSFLPMTLIGARRIVDSLNEAIQVSG